MLLLLALPLLLLASQIGTGSLLVCLLLLGLGLYMLYLNAELHCPIVHKAALVSLSNAMIAIAVNISLQVYNHSRNVIWGTDSILFLLMALKVAMREMHRLFGVRRGRTQHELLGVDPRGVVGSKGPSCASDADGENLQLQTTSADVQW